MHAKHQFRRANPTPLLLRMTNRRPGIGAYGSSDPGVVDPFNVVDQTSWNAIDGYIAALRECGVSEEQITAGYQELYKQLADNMAKFGATAQAVQVTVDDFGAAARSACESLCAEGDEACPAWAPAPKKGGGSSAAKKATGQDESYWDKIAPNTPTRAAAHTIGSGLATAVLGVATGLLYKKHPGAAVATGLGTALTGGWTAYSGFQWSKLGSAAG